MEIRCQIIFIKHRFWKIHELETVGIRKRILRTKLEGCSCDRKRPVVFGTFYTFVCIANQSWSATKNSSREKIQGNIWKVQNTTGRFLSQLHPSNFFLKILFRNDVLWKLFDVICQKRVRVFHQGFQTPRNWWKHEAAGRVLLLFRGVWNPWWNTKHEFLTWLLNHAKKYNAIKHANIMYSRREW